MSDFEIPLLLQIFYLIPGTIHEQTTSKKRFDPSQHSRGYVMQLVIKCTYL